MVNSMNDDTISRQAAISIPVLPKEHRNYRTYNLDDAYEDGWLDALASVNNLPSAERRGRWICDEWIGWVCSECGNQAPFWCISAAQNLTNYCPHCGVKMDGEQNE